MGWNFYWILRERERERERVLSFWSWKCYNFFYGYNCLENKDKSFLYKMYIKGFFLDREQKVHLKNTKCYMFMRFFFSLNFRITFISKKNWHFNDYLRRSIVALTNNFGISKHIFLTHTKNKLFARNFYCPSEIIWWEHFPPKILTF